MTLTGLALEYASIRLHPDRQESLAVSIVGATVVALGIASECSLHSDSSRVAGGTPAVHSSCSNASSPLASAVRRIRRDHREPDGAGPKTSEAFCARQAILTLPAR